MLRSIFEAKFAELKRPHLTIMMALIASLALAFVILDYSLINKIEGKVAKYDNATFWLLPQYQNPLIQRLAETSQTIQSKRYDHNSIISSDDLIKEYSKEALLKMSWKIGLFKYKLLLYQGSIAVEIPYLAQKKVNSFWLTERLSRETNDWALHYQKRQQYDGYIACYSIIAMMLLVLGSFALLFHIINYFVDVIIIKVGLRY